jgi:hypothetical protein
MKYGVFNLWFLCGLMVALWGETVIKEQSVGYDCVINKRKYTFVAAYQGGCSILKLISVLTSSARVMDIAAVIYVEI